MARRYTPFTGPNGEPIDEGGGGDYGNQAALEVLRRAAQQPQGAAPMGAPGPDFATENALRNRTINAREQQERLLQTAGDQERQAILTADTGKNYRTDAQMRPSLMGAEDERAQMNEGKPLRDLMSARVLAGFQDGAGAMSDAQMDQMALLGAIANKQPMPNTRGMRRQDELAGMQIEDYKRKAAIERIQQLSQNGDMAGAQMLAAEAGVAVPQQDINADQAFESLGSDVKAWGERGIAKDAEWLGFADAPVQEADLARFVEQANRAEQALIRQKHWTPERAAQEIDLELRRGAAAGVPTPWIEALLQRRAEMRGRQNPPQTSAWNAQSPPGFAQMPSVY
jgi:hypothetical protein